MRKPRKTANQKQVLDGLNWFARNAKVWPQSEGPTQAELEWRKRLLDQQALSMLKKYPQSEREAEKAEEKG